MKKIKFFSFYPILLIMIKFIFIFIFIFVFLFLELKASENWNVQLIYLMPKPLSKIVVGKSTSKDVLDFLGKPSLIEKNNHYYEQYGFKYSLEIIYANNKVKEYSYTFMSPRPVFDARKLGILKSKLIPYQPQSRSSLIYLKYTDDFGEMIIESISNSIYSVKIKK